MKLICEGKFVCTTEERKEHTAFPKWFCHTCNRYVLPDAKHRPEFETEGELVAFRIGKLVNNKSLFY